MEKTHWKKIKAITDPNYLGEGDFQDGEEKVLTLSHITQSETVTTAEGKSVKSVAHWKERDAKPMIMNVARSKAMEKRCGSPFIEDWVGKDFQLYIDNHVRAFGDIVAAVRVRPFAPKIRKAAPVPPCTDCKGAIQGDGAGHDSAWVAAYTAKHYGAPLCTACAAKRKAAKAAEEVKRDE